METKMDKFDLLIWIVGGGFTLNFTLLLVIWNSLNHRIDKLENRMDKFDEKLTDIDRRLCRMEGAFSSKEFCGLKDSSMIKRAE